jgi:hypothetical protein
MVHVGEGRCGGQRVPTLSTASRPVREAHRPQIQSLGVSAAARGVPPSPATWGQ